MFVSNVFVQMSNLISWMLHPIQSVSTIGTKTCILSARIEAIRATGRSTCKCVGVCVYISVHAVYSGQASALRQNIQSKGRFCKVHVRVVSFFAWSKIARRKRILLCTQPQVRGAVGLTGLKGFDWRVLVGASRLLAWSMTNTRPVRCRRRHV